jgi:hypothetical protein
VSAFTPPMRRVDRVYRGRPSHHYEDATGRHIPGVTTLIDKGIPKPALIRWGMNTTAEYAVNNWADLDALPVADRLKELKGAAYADRDRAAKRGSEIHGLAERLAHGEAVETPPEIAGHVDAYVAFLDEHEPEGVLAEVAVVNYTIGYAGTLDLIADMQGQRWLLDIKSTRSGVYGETALQLAGYRYAEKYVDAEGVEQDMPEVDRCGVVWVRADGYDLVPVEADPAVFLEFRYAMRIARWVDETSKHVIGKPLTAAEVA